MKIREISLENFRSFSSIQIHLPQVPILVIYDSNGSGKTTLLEGIIFGIKGEIEAYNSSEYGSIDALYNLREARNKRISSCILLEDNDNSVLIEANRPRRKKTYLTKNSKLDLIFKVNDEIKSLQEFQEICDNYLGIDYNMFPLANFLSQNVINDVLVSDAKVRGEVFSKLLSTDWINSMIDYISSNMTNIRKRKKILESKWDNLNLVLRNTQLDSLYQQIMDNVRLIVDRGISLDDKSKVNPIDINSRIKAMATLLNIDEITEYFSNNEIDKTLGKTRREKFVKRIFRAMNDLKISASVHEDKVDNMDATISEIKTNIRQKSIAEKSLTETRENIIKLNKVIKKKSTSKHEMSDKIIDIGEKLDTVSRKNKEIVRIEKQIKQIDKKFGNSEKTQLKKEEIEKNIDESTARKKALETVIPFIIDMDKKITRNQKEYTILEEKQDRLELEYPLEELLDKCRFIEKELRDIEIIEKIDVVDVASYNQQILNEFEEGIMNDRIEGIKKQIANIEYKSRLNELDKFIQSKENNDISEIKSVSSNIADIKIKLDRDIKDKDELISVKEKIEQNINTQMSISDKSMFNYLIILVSLVLSVVGVFGLPILMIFLLPAFLFIGIQINLISPAQLHVFIPLKYRIIKFEDELHELTDKIKSIDDIILHTEDKLKFYNDQLASLKKMNYKPPAWIDQTEPEHSIKEYRRIERISSELGVFDKLLHRMSKYNSSTNKMKKIENDSKELIDTVNKLDYLIDNEIKVNDYKELQALITEANETRDKLNLVIRDGNLRLEDIDKTINSRMEFERLLDESKFYNDSKISKNELIKLEKAFKSEIKALNNSLKRVEKEINVSSTELIRLNSAKGDLEGSIKAADKSIRRVLKELGISELPDNIDKEMERLFTASKKKVEESKYKIERIEVISKEIEDLNDHLKKWDLIQSTWKKHQSLVNDTQIKIREIEQMANKLKQMEYSFEIIKKVISEENEIYLKKLENDIINDLNNYFESLGGHDDIGDLNFNFKVTRNKLNAQLTVGYKDVTGAPRALYSNGQQVSLVIALFMATTKVNNMHSKLKWIGFDEPTQFLDTDRKINFIETLKLFYNDLDKPQIIISTADSEFIDLIKDEDGIQVLTMSELINYRIELNEKPRVDLLDGRFSLGEKLVIPELDTSDMITFDDELPTKARKEKAEFEGIEIICEVCGKSVMVATRARICGDKECITARKRSFFS